MLRSLVKDTLKKAIILGRNGEVRKVQLPSLYMNPRKFFSNNEPPKGFEKFKRKKQPVNKKTFEEEELVNPQKIEPVEDTPEVKKRETKEKSEVEAEAETKSSRQQRENKEEEREEKEKKEEHHKREEEEHIENEEHEKEKKPKKKQQPDAFFTFLNWQKKGDGKGTDPKKPPKIQVKYLLMGGVAGFLTVQALLQYYNEKDNITYNDFIKNYLEPEKVNKISIRRISDGANSYRTIAVIHTTLEGDKTLVLGNVDHFLENLEKFQLEKGKSAERFVPIQYDYRADASKVLDRIISFFYLGLTIAILYSIFKQFKGLGGMGKGGGAGDIFNMGKSQVKVYGLDDKIKTRFKDVAGLEEAKVEITEFVDFLKKPKKFKEIGAKIPRGALLTGPPGTGKTLLAKAAAGEAGVPFLYISGSDFVEMFVGVGASRVRDLFKKAKDNAPSIIFIDEIDAVGRKRESKMGGNDERDNTLNQLLVEMDGFGTETNVVVMAATNRKELLDPALTRPGRLDRSIEITLPDLEGRKEIFLVHLKPLKLDPSKTMEEYAKRLATLSPGFSGAEIANLCNEAAILAARRNKQHISSEEFESASERVLAGLEKKRIVSEEERRIVAIHESGHAVVSWFLEGGFPLLKLTIIPRSKGSLGFAQYLPNESMLETKEELLDRVCSILGGRCSEEFFNGRITTGAYDDLKKAYDIVNNMVTKFGMSERIGFVGFSEDEYYRKTSDQTAKAIDDEIKRVVDECTVRTKAIIKEHKHHIEQLAEKLLEKETLDLQAIIAILGERPFAPKSNFKAFLEYKKEQEKEIEENKEKEKKEKESEEKNEKENKEANA